MRLYRLILILLVAFLFIGCVSVFKKKAHYPPIMTINTASIEPEQFADYIDQLVKISEDDPVTANRIRALRMIAQGLAHHKNPVPDYIRALTYFEKYLEQSPQSDHKNEILDWIGILRLYRESVLVLEKTRNEMDLLCQNNKKNIELARQQEKVIEKLKNDIKKLDSLYFKIEQKKKKKNNQK